MGNTALNRQITQRLKEGGWSRLRTNGKHAVWEHPSGVHFTAPSTSKDTSHHRANYLTAIARLERQAMDTQGATVQTLEAEMSTPPTVIAPPDSQPPTVVAPAIEVTIVTEQPPVVEAPAPTLSKDDDIWRIVRVLSKARLTDQEVHSLVDHMIHDVENVLLGETCK